MVNAGRLSLSSISSCLLSFLDWQHDRHRLSTLPVRLRVNLRPCRFATSWSTLHWRSEAGRLRSAAIRSGHYMASNKYGGNWDSKLAWGSWKSWKPAWLCVLFMLTARKPAQRFWCFFPRASERRVLPIAGVCKTSSHLLIFTSSHIFSSSHLLIFTSSHIFSHLLTSSHIFLHLLTSSHIFSHLLTSSHIFSSSHLLISRPLLLFVSRPAQPFRTKWGSIAKNLSKIAICKSSGATLSHEMRFDRQKLR